MTSGIPGASSRDLLQPLTEELGAVVHREVERIRQELTRPYRESRAGARLLGGSAVLGSMAAGSATALVIRLHNNDEGSSGAVSENRLTSDQLAALAPGDSVPIECAGDFRRTRYVAGTVVRIAGLHIVVSVKGPRGMIYQERYGRRDGVRDGKSLTRTELVNGDGQSDAKALRPTQRIDVLYREWARDRSDAAGLRPRFVTSRRASGRVTMRAS